MQVTEIFESIQGETTRAGCPCAFVRFTGCDLRCVYCDSTYAYAGGQEMTPTQIMQKLDDFGARSVTLTGGEPMLQPGLEAFCEQLLAKGWEVAVETHGQRPLDRLPAGVSRIIDVKTPGSGQEDRAFLNLKALRPGDEIKFVITSQADFQWAQEVSLRHGLQQTTVPILLSPVFGKVSPADLVRWMLAARFKARLNLQIHKYVWDSNARGV